MPHCGAGCWHSTPRGMTSIHLSEDVVHRDGEKRGREREERQMGEERGERRKGEEGEVAVQLAFPQFTLTKWVAKKK